MLGLMGFDAPGDMLNRLMSWSRYLWRRGLTTRDVDQSQISPAEQTGGSVLDFRVINLHGGHTKILLKNLKKNRQSNLFRQSLHRKKNPRLTLLKETKIN